MDMDDCDAKLIQNTDTQSAVSITNNGTFLEVLFYLRTLVKSFKMDSTSYSTIPLVRVLVVHVVMYACVLQRAAAVSRKLS